MKRALCLVMVMLMLCSCGDGNTVSEESSSPQQSSSTTKVPEKEQNSVGIDGTISGEYFDISITDMKWTDVLETSIGTVNPQNDESKLLCVIFSSINTTDETKNLGMFSAYVDKRAVLPSVVVGGIDDAMAFVGAVAGGMEMKAYSVWELPEDWEEFQLNYFEATGSECKQHFVIYREDIE